MARRRRAKSSRGSKATRRPTTSNRSRKRPERVGAPDDKEIRAALAERDEKIAELERQIADAAKTVESAEALAKQVEELKAASDAERCEFELRLTGALLHNLRMDVAHCQ